MEYGDPHVMTRLGFQTWLLNLFSSGFWWNLVRNGCESVLHEKLDLKQWKGRFITLGTKQLGRLFIGHTFSTRTNCRNCSQQALTSGGPWFGETAQARLPQSHLLPQCNTIQPYKTAMICVGVMRKNSAMAGVAWYMLSLALMLSAAAEGQLNPTFYHKSCPEALATVESAVKAAVAKEKRMGASLLRLHFHDCFVNGCDGSVLLDDSSTITGEKGAAPNANSARGFEVVDGIKARLEAVCPGVVSCADILAIAARDSVVALGGPWWRVLLGRRDSATASKAAANNDIPSPFSSFTTLVSNFQAHGLSTKDLIALSGAHTIGKARCAVFRGRIYNDSNIDAAYAQSLRRKCPANGGGVNNLFPLDSVTPTIFDNSYYRNLVKRRGLLHSDQAISINSRVNAYATNPRAFAIDFAAAMLKMGNFRPLTGTNGEIRRNCRRPN